MNKISDPNLRRAISHIAGLLAGDARFLLTDGGDGVELVTRHSFDFVAFRHMQHNGWLESMPNGGTFKLSDEGLRAYLQSTDEMQDGELVDPIVSNAAHLHPFKAHRKYPWFCAECGYAEHERLKHPQPGAPS